MSAVPAGSTGHRRVLGLLLASLTMLVATTVAVPGRADADVLLIDTFRAEAGPFGAISVLGDSVLLGSGYYAPTLNDQLAARGWGPIRFIAGVGHNTGAFGGKLAVQTSYIVQQWRASGWDPPNVMVNIGANDSVTCDGNVDCAYAAIMHLVNAIGPGHQIWWPYITRHPVYIHQQNGWNAALQRVADERDDFFTWDWATVMNNGPFPTSDWTHLDANGYRLRSGMIARELTADLTRAARTGPDAPLAAPIGEAAEFVPLPPVRVLDTRSQESPIGSGGHVEIDMTPFVPEGASAVAVNLTSDATHEPGFLTGYPCDRAPGSVSNVNHAAAVPRGAMAVVPLSADGRLCVLTRASGHVIVDLQGAFVSGGDDGTRLTPIDPPQRLLDTRQSGRSSVVEFEAPEGAAAVAINLTATGVEAAGWLKAYPCDQSPPEVSNVNYIGGDTVAVAAFVPVSADGTVCVQSLVPVDVVIDITGVFTEGGALAFVPAEPTRMLDTRTGIGGWSPIHGGGQTLDVRVAPPGAEAVTATITIVGPLRDGWLAAAACGQPTPTSSVNAVADAVFANATTVGVDDAGDVCLTALSATHTLFDVTGWWVA
jgi:hypothetical protein